MASRKKRPAGIAALPVTPARRPRVAANVPHGKLEMVVTYLEMRRPPRPRRAARRTEKLALLRAERPTVSFYRYLYDTVGEPWLWFERRMLDDAALAAIVHDPNVAIYVLYVSGVPAGYFELDCRRKGDIELAYFGLVPEFIGRGLGTYLLDHAVDEAWMRQPSRLWVHTCNLDHPSAIAVYQRAGFEAYDQETTIVDDPRVTGVIAKG